MSRIQSRKIRVNGIDVHYFTGGRGRPLLLLHGGAAGARTWLKTMSALSEKYAIFAPDLPGFGDSQPLAGTCRLPALVDFVGSLVENLGLDRFYLVGHSLGGGVAIEYSLKYPEKVRKLVLVSSLCLGKEIALWVRLLSLPVICQSVGTVLISVLKGVKWLARALVVPVEFAVPYSQASIDLGSSLTSLKQQTLVLANRLSEILMPTLLVWGASDPIVPVSQAYAAARVIPDCRLKVFKNRGHSVYRDNEIPEFSNLLAGFLG